MKNHLLCFIFLLVINLNFKAQNETTNWYFSNKVALNFDDGKVTQLSDSKMNAPAGSASISDKDGLLLFYSDGETVWNKNHEIMENGSGLYGEKTNSQSSIIIPKPSSNSRYYIFTTRKNDLSSPIVVSGIYYSEIEISEQFPLGKVIIKNFRLDNSTTEKITAIHHKNGEDIWVITNGNNTYDKTDNSIIFSYKVTAKGVQLPIVNDLNNTIHSKLTPVYGQMKISPDGSKFALTNGTWLYIYEFDKETGLLSKFKFSNLLLNFTEGHSGYGVAFSQNSKILYYTTQYFPGRIYTLMQLDLSNTNAEFLGNPIYTSALYKPGSLQIAIDGRIYATLKNIDESLPSSKMGVINYPEKLGVACDFDDNEITLKSGESELGLPNFIQSYFASRIISKNECFINEFNFTAVSYLDITKIDWDFGDGNTASGLNVNHLYTLPGNYLVKANLTLKNNSVVKVKKLYTAYELPILKNNQFLAECDDDIDGLSMFNLKTIVDKITNPTLVERLEFYLSQNDVNNGNIISNPEVFENTIPNQEIYVKVFNYNGCFELSKFTVNASFIALENVPDLVTCKILEDDAGNDLGDFNLVDLENSTRNELNIPLNSTIKFYPTYEDALTTLNEFDSRLLYPSSTIFLKVQDANLGCGGITPVKLIVNPDPIINLQDSYTICINPNLKPPIIVSADDSNDRYEWRNSQGNIISISKDFTLNTIGEFSLTAYKTENGILCSNSKTFVVKNPEKAIFSNIEVNTEDEKNNIVTVSIVGNSTYEFSLDNVNFFSNSTIYTFNNVEAGLRTIYVRDINNCEESISTNVTVIGFKKFFTPNGDGNNDYWTIDGMNKESFKSINVRIFDRYGKLVHQITDLNSIGWDGTYNSEKLISNNYWFKADIVDIDNNLISKSGNFSLIRN